jgi:hypothetical protein
MAAFFSGTDDANELDVPGLHFVLGKITKAANTIEVKASVVLRRNRYEVEPEDVIDMRCLEEVNFHESVLGLIKRDSLAWHTRYAGDPYGLHQQYAAPPYKHGQSYYKPQTGNAVERVGWGDQFDLEALEEEGYWDTGFATGGKPLVAAASALAPLSLPTPQKLPGIEISESPNNAASAGTVVNSLDSLVAGFCNTSTSAIDRYALMLQLAIETLRSTDEGCEVVDSLLESFNYMPVVNDETLALNDPFYVSK